MSVYDINKINYGGNTYNLMDGIEVTQAEYDALSTEEKNNGRTYFITDGEPGYTRINDSVPIGAIQAFGGSSLPYGWLFCDGSAVSRTEYSELFAAIGIAHGAGDGSTTFNLPDLRGRVLAGYNSSVTAFNQIGKTGGSKDAIVPYHNHTATGGSVSDKAAFDTGDQSANHTHGFTSYKTGSAGNGTSNTYHPVYSEAGTGSSTTETNNKNHHHQVPAHGHGFTQPTISYAGSSGNATDANLQPYTVANYIIKARNIIDSTAIKELDPQSIIFNMLHPVGSYFETSDISFDPNRDWTGTWILDNSNEYTESKKVLWTNPNVEAVYSPATVSLNLSAYDAVDVCACHYADNSAESGVEIEIGGRGVFLLPGSVNAGLTTRTCDVSTTGVTFSAGATISGTTRTTDNYAAIPKVIYGIKKRYTYRWHRTA